MFERFFKKRKRNREEVSGNIVYNIDDMDKYSRNKKIMDYCYKIIYVKDLNDSEKIMEINESILYLKF